MVRSHSPANSVTDRPLESYATKQNKTMETQYIDRNGKKLTEEEFNAQTKPEQPEPDPLVSECNDLREIFPKILEALGSGACAATCSVDFLREIPKEVGLVRQRLERERDEWKAKYIQQNKDLGCEMMDPNGTIWDYARGLQRERDALRAALNLAGFLWHQVDHPKSMQHKDGGSGPVEALIQDALTQMALPSSGRTAPESGGSTAKN
jgi:hypothetical protein